MKKNATLAITLLADPDNGWIMPYVRRAREALSRIGHRVVLKKSHRGVVAGDCLFILGYTRLVPGTILKRNRFNLVVHESALPKGRGWAPLSWQVLEGKRTIPVALFEAAPGADAGPVYMRETIRLKGHELCADLRQLQGEATLKLILEFVRRFPGPRPRPQRGTPTYYRRRTPADSRLDISKTLKELFRTLQVTDNERYPAYFDHRGRRYILKIYRQDAGPKGCCGANRS